jgi:hypothetical protein
MSHGKPRSILPVLVSPIQSRGLPAAIGALMPVYPRIYDPVSTRKMLNSVSGTLWRVYSRQVHVCWVQYLQAAFPPNPSLPRPTSLNPHPLSFRHFQHLSVPRRIPTPPIPFHPPFRVTKSPLDYSLKAPGPPEVSSEHTLT